MDVESGTRGSWGHGTVRGHDATRVEIWIHPSVHPGVASHNEGIKSGKGSKQDGGLRALSASDVSAASNPHNFNLIMFHVC